MEILSVAAGHKHSVRYSAADMPRRIARGNKSLGKAKKDMGSAKIGSDLIRIEMFIRSTGIGQKFRLGPLAKIGRCAGHDTPYPGTESSMILNITISSIVEESQILRVECSFGDNGSIADQPPLNGIRTYESEQARFAILFSTGNGLILLVRLAIGIGIAKWREIMHAKIFQDNVVFL